MISTILFCSQIGLVSLQISGERLEIAGPKIARALGYKLTKLSPKLINEVLLISVHDVPRAEFLNKFEEATRMKFFQQPDGVSLELSPDEERAEELAEKRDIQDRIKRILEKAKSQVKKMPRLNSEYCRDLINKMEQDAPKDRASSMQIWKKQLSRANRHFEDSPGGRLTFRLLSSLELSDLNQLSASKPRLVLSSKPTRMQRALPASIEEYISDYVDESSVFNAAFRSSRLFGEDKLNRGYPSTFSLGLDVGRITYRRLPDGTLVRSEIPRQEIFRRDIDCITISATLNPVFSFTIKVFDQKGNSVFSQPYPDGIQIEDELDRSTYGILKNLDLKDRNPNLEFSRAYLKGIRRYEIPSISDELSRALLNPETIDPLSLGIPELIKGFAGARNVIAVLDDSLLGCTSIDSTANFPLSARAIDYREGETLVTDQWLLRSLRNPKVTRRTQIDRQKLGKLLRSIHLRQSPPSIEEESAFLSELPHPGPGLQPYWNMVRSMGPNFPVFSFDAFEIQALSIYGSLSQTERSTAKNGINLQLLNTRAQSTLYRIIFQDNLDELRYESVEPKNITFDDFQSSSWSSRGSLENLSNSKKYLTALMSQPTFGFPDGLVPGMQLYVREKVVPILLNGSPRAGYFSRWRAGISPEAYGKKIRAKREGKLQSKYGSSLSDPNAEIDENQILTGVKRVIELGVGPSDSPIMHSWSIQRDIVTDRKVYSIETLPAEFKEELLYGLGG